MNVSKIIITCAPLNAPYLEYEIKHLGYKVLNSTILNVELEGTMADAMNLNLNLRTASKVLFLIKEFKAAKPDELYSSLGNIPWERMIGSRGYVRIENFVKNDQIKDTRFASLKTKDAIVDRIKKVKGRRPDTGPAYDKTVIFLHWVQDKASIYINTSGDTISKHGYRKNPYKAPMMEALAASAILASKWDKKSHFINPMCGSGTLAIEAALLACDIAPGLFRNNFGFMHIKPFDGLEWKKLQNEARKKIKKSLPFKIVASDIDPKAIEIAKKNAANAGVENLIDFKVCNFKKTNMPKDNKGIIFMNPEYGERLGDALRLGPLYSDIGNFFKQKGQGYTGYVFTGNLKLAKKIGLRTTKKIEFLNGKIDCRLLEFDLYAGSKK